MDSRKVRKFLIYGFTGCFLVGLAFMFLVVLLVVKTNEMFPNWYSTLTSTSTAIGVSFLKVMFGQSRLQRHYDGFGVCERVNPLLQPTGAGHNHGKPNHTYNNMFLNSNGDIISVWPLVVAFLLIYVYSLVKEELIFRYVDRQFEQMDRNVILELRRLRRLEREEMDFDIWAERGLAQEGRLRWRSHG